MAKLLGTIEEADIANLPQAVQEAIKAADAQQGKTAALETEVAELKKKMTPEPPPNPGPKVITPEEINFNNRRDIILMKLSNNPSDLMTAKCVQLFETEITKILDSSAPELRADEVYIKNVVDMVKGRHTAEIVDALRNPTPDNRFNSLFVESSSGGGKQKVEKKPADLLTDEEKRVADRYGISYDTYAENLASVRGGV